MGHGMLQRCGWGVCFSRRASADVQLRTAGEPRVRQPFQVLRGEEGSWGGRQCWSGGKEDIARSDRQRGVRLLELACERHGAQLAVGMMLVSTL